MRVVHVADGDTIVCLDSDWSREVVRLGGVDAPEKRQAFGMRAKDFTARMVGSQVVTVEEGRSDRYGRVIGEVCVGGKSLNQELIKNGLAWWYREYSKDARLGELEMAARQQRVGLWSDDQAVAPWEFRKARREEAKRGSCSGVCVDGE
jgi:micrococcal nuclease